MKVTSILALARALAAAVILPIAPALAQQGATEIEEVVVKARKREESLQDVPIAITTFTEMTIRRVGIERPADFISPVPNMTIVDTANIGDLYDTIDLRAGFEGDTWTLTAWGRDITDEDYLDEVIPAPEFGGTFNHEAPLSAYGIELEFRGE